MRVAPGGFIEFCRNSTLGEAIICFVQKNPSGKNSAEEGGGMCISRDYVGEGWHV